MIPIPEFLKHLKVNPKGYPIPFFVAYVNGKPDFRLLDPKKQMYCIEQKLCAICGKKLIKHSYYFIGGPQGYFNKVSTDPAMHRICAEYSLKSCPHLHVQKTERRETGLEDLAAQQDWHSNEKPTTILLIKADSFSKFKAPNNHHTLIKYKPISYEIYVYENGLLEKSLLPS